MTYYNLYFNVNHLKMIQVKIFLTIFFINETYRICNLLSFYIMDITSIKNMIHLNRNKSSVTLYYRYPYYIFGRENIKLLTFLIVQSFCR